MGFFKDFKRDFAQAVNELMPDKDELAAEYDDEDMVNTFDEADDIEVAPEDIFEDLDEITGSHFNAFIHRIIHPLILLTHPAYGVQCMVYSGIVADNFNRAICASSINDDVLQLEAIRDMLICDTFQRLSEAGGIVVVYGN